MIVFNEPPYLGNDFEYALKALKDYKKVSGDGEFTKMCNRWLENKTMAKKVLLTTSCTHALEMAAILCDIQKGDEVIMPSYTFVSTANAFVNRGAKIKFVDVRPDTMNIDEKKIEEAITNKTKVIVPVHYAGVSCEMDTILSIAQKYKLWVVEDAAQGVMSSYKGSQLGAIGDIGCYSFHETKNYSMGEGGAFITNRKEFAERAEIIREKGTNRSRFFRGQVDKYTWVDMGSSYLPSEINASYLYKQLEIAEQINDKRRDLWNLYYSLLGKLYEEEKIKLPYVPNHCIHNAHMFYIKVKDLEERVELIKFLKGFDICSVFHYVPLHSSPAGIRYGEFVGEDKFTTRESERLLRLPLFYNLEQYDVEFICSKILKFYNDR